MGIWEPPLGFDDMLVDAERAPTPTIGFEELSVRGVGTVQARRPLPAAAVLLALSVRPREREDGETEDDARAAQLAAQQPYLRRFIRDHLADGEYERILLAMMDDEHDAAAFSRVAAAVATWGTARPFGAVVSLALAAAMTWRDLRTRIRAYGVADPMALPSMHALLDEAEKLWREGLYTGDTDKDRAAVDSLNNDLYAPDPDDTASIESGKRGKTAPAWYTGAKAEASFDAAARTLGGAR